MRTDESVSDSVSRFDSRRVDVQGVEFKSLHFLIFLLNNGDFMKKVLIATWALRDR